MDADEIGQQVATAPSRHEPQEGLGQRDGWHAGRDGAVVASERDLDAATHGGAVDEGEGGHRQVHDRPEDRMPGPRDFQRLLAFAGGRDRGQVGAHGEDEGFAGDTDGLDFAGLGPRLQARDDLGQPRDRRRAEGVGLGVVEAVVEGNQRHRAGACGQGEIPHERLGHDLVGELRGRLGGKRLGHGIGLFPVVGVVGVFPDDGAAHPQADAHRGQAVAHVGVGLEVVGQLRHQPHPAGGERVSGGDRAAIRVDAGVVVGDAEVVEEGEDLHGEGLVELEESDVRNRQAGLGEGFLGRRDRADAHDLGLDADEGELDQAHSDGQPELLGGVLRGEQAGGRAVVDAGRIAGGHPSVRPEGRLERTEIIEGGAGARWLVGDGEAVSLLRTTGGDRHQIRLDLAGLIGRGELVLGGDREGVRALLGQLRVAVVQVLGGLAHHQRGGVDELLGDDPRVGVDALAHRVAPHVLDPTGDGDIDRTEGDLTGR